MTGGASGIGRAVARAFLDLGGGVVAADRSPSLAEQGAQEPRPVVALCDVTDPGACDAAVAATVERFGRLDVLVAAAGVADQSLVATGDRARWRQIVETNLLGTMFVTRAALPTMLAAGGGHIFVIASVSGREAYPGEAAYIASKWGQVGFAHALRQELLEERVRVTLIEPGIVDTPLTRGNPTARPLLAEVDPLTPDDVARAVVFAWSQPLHVAVSELTVRPQRQRPPTFDLT